MSKFPHLWELYRKPREKETWWWNKEVQRCLREKKEAYKRLKDGSNHQAYKNKKEAKRAVAKARGEVWREWYNNLEIKQGEENIFRIARTGAKQKKDIVHTAVIRNDDQKVLTKKDIKKGGKSTSRDC